MARILGTGPGKGTKGKVSGHVYYELNGETIVRSTPVMPHRVYETHKQKKHLLLFRMIQKHIKTHRGFINKYFDCGSRKTSGGNYHHLNYKPLCEALDALAEEALANGSFPDSTQIENAIAAYSRRHKEAILIAHREGFPPIYLAGNWPQVTITLDASKAKE